MTIKEHIDKLAKGASGDSEETIHCVEQHIIGLETQIALMRGQIEGLRVKCGEITAEEGIRHIVESHGGNFHAEGADFVDEESVG